MSRIDWIVKLREIFYQLANYSNSPKKKASVKAEEFMVQLLRCQDKLSLTAVDDYRQSDKRHESPITLSTVLNNLQDLIKYKKL